MGQHLERMRDRLTAMKAKRQREEESCDAANDVKRKPARPARARQVVRYTIGGTEGYSRRVKKPAG